jgi:hypothetical protein
MNTPTEIDSDPILEQFQSTFNLSSGHISFLSRMLPSETQLLIDLGQRLLAVEKDASKGGRKPYKDAK